MNFPSEQNYIEQLSIDCVIFGYHHRQLKVLVPKLDFQGDFWALPSGFVGQGEDIDAAASRILQQRTGIRKTHVDQFHVFGKAGRSNQTFLNKLIELNKEKLGEKAMNEKEYDWITKRFVSIGYYALVDINKVTPEKIDIDASIDWYDVQALPAMIMDHNEIVARALEHIRINMDEKLLAFKLLSETFTMKEIQELYETVFDKPFARNNFQKKILDMNVLNRLEKKFTGAANKAPFLYKLK